MRLNRRRQERLELRAALQSDPAAAVPRLQPVTHREGSPTLAPPVQARPRAFPPPPSPFPLPPPACRALTDMPILKDRCIWKHHRTPSP